MLLNNNLGLLIECYLKEGLRSVSGKKVLCIYYKTVSFSVSVITVRNNWKCIYNM